MSMKDLNDTKLLQATFEEVGNIKEEITEIKIEVNDKFDEMKEEMNEKFESQSEKLDKILEVVSEKFASHHKRITRIEDHFGLTTLM